MKDVIVLAGAPWSVLSLCRLASKYNRRSFVVCFDAIDDVFAKSKYVTKVLNVDSNEIVYSFTEFCKEYIFEDKPILFVASDKACEIVMEYRMFFESKFDVSMPSNYIVSSFVNKDLANIVANKNGLMTPKTLGIQTIEDREYVLENFHFPVILKPFAARDSKLIGFKFEVCDKNKFIAISDKLLNSNKHLLCQEYIKGDDADSKFYIFYRNSAGNIIECMGEKTLQTNGIMTVGTVIYDKEMASISREFLDLIDYVGIGGIEYKKYDGKYYFIEMSTRTEGFLPICDMAGCSIAEVAYLDVNGIDINYKYKKEIRNKTVYVAFFSFLIDRLRCHKFFDLVKDMFIFILSSRVHFVEVYTHTFYYYLFYYMSRIINALKK